MKRLLLIVAALLVPSTVNAKELTLPEIMKGSVRISSKSSDGRTHYGSGTVIQHSHNKYFILTNGHVTDKIGSNAYVEFFKDGIFSKKYTGKVRWRIFNRGSSRDIAVVEVPDNIFGGAYHPTVIPLVSKDYKWVRSQLIYGAGCPAARWMQGWHTRLLADYGNVIKYSMPPEGGQSGSGILVTVKNAKGEKFTRLAGVVTWRIGNNPDNSYGMGVTIKRIFDVFSGNSKVDKLEDYKLDRRTAREVGHFCPRCNKDKKDHLIITDGKNPSRFSSGELKLYCPKDKDALEKYKSQNFSDKFRILRFEDCPDGKCFPWKRKGDSSPLPDFGGNPKPEPDNSLIIQLLQDQIKKAEAKVKELTEKLKEYADSNADYEGQIKVLKDSIANLKGIKENLEAKTGELSNQKDEISNLFGMEKTKNAALETSNLELIEENKLLSDRLKSFLNRFDIPVLGPLGTFIAAILALISSGAVGATVWHRWLYPFLVRRFGKIPVKILSGIGKRRLRRRHPELYERLFAEKSEKKKILVEEKLEKEYNNIGDESEVLPFPIEPDSINNEEPESTDEKSVVTPTNSNTESVTVGRDVKVNSDNVYQFGKLAEIGSSYPVHLFNQGSNFMEGLHVKEWAVRAGLYQEAINKLKNGELEFKPGVPLNGQVLTAKTIEEWVEEQVYKDARITEYEDEKAVYYEGYLGWLYYRAVLKLKNGEFNVLGHKESAEAIEKWVRHEFYSRIIK